MTGNVRQTAPELTWGTLRVTCDNSPTADGTGPQKAPEGTEDMNSIDRLRDYVLTAPSICSTTRAILVGYIDSIDAEHQKLLDEWKVEYGQMWLKGYSECHAELLEGNETLASDLERCGWIRLPVDADGVPIHVGDVMDEQLPFGGYAAPAPVDTMELSRGAGGYGWMVRLDSESGAFINPKLLRHHHAPTVEDVLEEFVARWMETHHDDIPALKAEYAAKLRLASNEE